MKCRILAVLLLAAWGAAKTPWEQRMAAERRVTMGGSDLAMNFQLRDSLGQGLSVAALGGFRGLAANFLWISLTGAWEEKQWTRVRTLAELAVLMQPRVVFFWEMGAWQLAWNASIDAEQSGRTGGIESGNRDSRMWIEAGRRMLERGIETIPERYELYRALAMLYQDRCKDYVQAAHYYELASQRPGAPVYLERFPGFMLENAGKKREAYEYWKKLWLGSREHGPGPHRWEMVWEHMRKLEKDLNIPLEKKVSPG
ncbi:MAG: hypothetical protein PHD76_06770 [Methylacidiphilales bacterium]|nr:hypothetical protein [Candidatus Methylacidiphilales bacterium]